MNVTSQLAWVNLGLEVVQEGLILPLFFLLGSTLADRERTVNKVKTGLLTTFGVFALVSLLVAAFARPLVVAMAQSPAAIPATVSYIRWEMVATPLLALVRFLFILFVMLDWRRHLYGMLAVQMVATVTLDAFLLSRLSFSLDVGVNGIAYSNIVASGATLAYALVVFARRYALRAGDVRRRPDFGWLRTWWAVGRWAGLDSFIRNAFYLVFIVRMMNVVQEQGTYWLANGFVWTWLLLPLLPLAETLRRDVAANPPLDHKEKTLAPFSLGALLVLAWLLTVPLWDAFLAGVLNVPEPAKVKGLVLLLVPFYALFVFNTLADSVLYGKGKTSLLALQSLVTNVSVYGVAFALFAAGWFTPTLLGIALLFGIGIAVDTLVTFALYARYLRSVDHRL